MLYIHAGRGRFEMSTPLSNIGSHYGFMLPKTQKFFLTIRMTVDDLFLHFGIIYYFLTFEIILGLNFKTNFNHLYLYIIC